MALHWVLWIDNSNIHTKFHCVSEQNQTLTSVKTWKLFSISVKILCGWKLLQVTATSTTSHQVHGVGEMLLFKNAWLYLGELSQPNHYDSYRNLLWSDNTRWEKSYSLSYANLDIDRPPPSPPTPPQIKQSI